MPVALLTVKLEQPSCRTSPRGAVKPVPVIATEVLPVLGPELGLTPVTVGAWNLGELAGSARGARAPGSRAPATSTCAGAGRRRWR